MTQLQASDGHTLDCWTAKAQGERLGGIVIAQEIFGVTDQLKELAETYTQQGYDIVIPALFDRVEKNAVVPFADTDRARSLMAASELEDNLLDLDAAANYLRNQAKGATANNVCVMGFCWGGGLALRAAQKLEISGAIVFYGTRLGEYLDSPIASPVLGHFGAEDSHVPMDLLNQTKAYLPDMESHVYDAGHAFANHAREAYVEEAAEQAHSRNMDFLNRIFAPMN